ncbi:MAG: ribosome-binding protein aMBF1 (putative translation factor) [Phenylobacterium sp.]|jgi:ribosome-binding protein aMBF1 (putative translation factor)
MTMQATKQKKLESSGWKVGSVDELLDLSAEESAYIEMKIALSDSLKKQRLKENMSQVELAERVKSSQSRIAKMEAGDPSVSIDLLMKSLLALGVSTVDLAKTISATSH